MLWMKVASALEGLIFFIKHLFVRVFIVSYADFRQVRDYALIAVAGPSKKC